MKRYLILVIIAQITLLAMGVYLVFTDTVLWGLLICCFNSYFLGVHVTVLINE